MFPLPPLTDEQRRVVERVAALARERFAPRAARYDADSTFPYENYADLHAAGLHALTVPREYGGVGADAVTYVHALREMAKGCSATALGSGCAMAWLNSGLRSLSVINCGLSWDSAVALSSKLASSRTLPGK